MGRETMTTVKKIINPTGDQGSQEAFRTASNLKSSAGDLSQLAKLTKNYCQANQHSIDAGKQLVDHLVKITTKMEQRLGAVSQSLIEISSTEKTIFSKMDKLNTTTSEKLESCIQNHLQHERTEIQSWEKNFHKRHAEIVSQLRKAEKETKKSGKKSPYQLQQAIQDLTDKMNEMTTHRQQKLEEFLRVERKRYCYIVELLTNMIDAQQNYFTTSNQLLSDQLQPWKAVAGSADTLSQECQSLISQVGVKERTSASLQGSTGGSDEGYYDENQGYDESSYYEAGYEEGYYEESYAEESYGSTFQARALYDYQGSHSYELAFKTGDIITVTKEDPSTGWWIGELNGVVGPFPGNYV